MRTITTNQPDTHGRTDGRTDGDRQSSTVINNLMETHGNDGQTDKKIGTITAHRQTDIDRSTNITWSYQNITESDLQ